MISMITSHKNFFVFTINVLFSVIILIGLLIIPVHAAGSTTVKVDLLSQTISSGSTFTINIACVPSQSIKAFELQVVFNPSLLKANSVAKGNIFNSYSTFFNPGSIDNVKGTITDVYDLILGKGMTSSSGTLVTISFTAKSTSGTSTINLKNVGVTNDLRYVPITITNGSVQIIVQSQQSNKPLVCEPIAPANKSSNIPISTTSLKLTIRDPEGKSFNYTIQTRPNVGSVSVNNAGNGTKSCAISGLKYATTYRWYVNATDGHTWTRLWYTFTTQQQQYVEVLDQLQTKYTNNFALYSTRLGGQSFKPTMGLLTSAELYIRKIGNPPNSVTLAVRSSKSGSDLVTISKPVSEISTSYGWVKFDFSDLPVTPGNLYYLVLRTSGGSSSNCYYWGYGYQTSYTNGIRLYSTTGGSSWINNPSYDTCFKTYGI
jgi:hypothetical protein